VNQPKPPRGRGAGSNRSGRFESHSSEDFDDGWSAADEAAPKLGTEIRRDTARTLISYNDSPDIPFDRSINPYRGCEHGCIYCYARPSHAYLGHSPGLDFESLLYAKPNAAERLKEELAKPGYRCAPMALGANTDAWQPIERRLGITRDLIQVLHDCEHPLAAISKSALIERDLDLLAPMAAKRQAAIYISLTTLDAVLARRLEPRAASPARRLQTIRALTDAGISVGVLIAPIIPVLTDTELESLLEAAAEAGAKSAGHILLRLPQELPELFREWLTAHYPDRAAHVMKRVQDTRGGRDYRADFATRMRGSGAFAGMINQRFELARRRFGLAERSLDLDCSRFRPPSLGGQLPLL
jgi:DNA repair photolyase